MRERFDKVLPLICIYLSPFFIFAATSRSQLTSNATAQLGDRHIACPDQTVIFMCTVTNTLYLDWTVEPHIKSASPIRFLPNNSVRSTIYRNQFTANLTSVTTSPSDAGRATMTSTLKFVASDSLNGSVIECHDSKFSMGTMQDDTLGDTQDDTLDGTIIIAGTLMCPIQKCITLFCI